jgi:glycogen debranching enzyme
MAWSANVFVQPDVRADDTFLFDYSLFFVDVLYNYLQSTGDMETARELWPTARRQIEALTRCDPRVWCATAMTGGYLSTGRRAE